MLRLLLSTLLLATFCACEQLDLTRQDDANGAHVVEAVISMLRHSCIFDDSLQYLRRKAYVDTHDGTDPHTFVLGFHGGIWKVNWNF